MSDFIFEMQLERLSKDFKGLKFSYQGKIDRQVSLANQLTAGRPAHLLPRLWERAKVFFFFPPAAVCGETEVQRCCRG